MNMLQNRKSIFILTILFLLASAGSRKDILFSESEYMAIDAWGKLKQ